MNKITITNNVKVTPTSEPVGNSYPYGLKVTKIEGASMFDYNEPESGGPPSESDYEGKDFLRIEGTVTIMIPGYVDLASATDGFLYPSFRSYSDTTINSEDVSYFSLYDYSFHFPYIYITATTPDVKITYDPTLVSVQEYTEIGNITNITSETMS